MIEFIKALITAFSGSPATDAAAWGVIIVIAISILGLLFAHLWVRSEARQWEEIAKLEQDFEEDDEE